MGQERDNVRETNRSLRNVQTEGKDRRNSEWRWLGVQLVRGNRETPSLKHIQELKFNHSNLHEVLHQKTTIQPILIWCKTTELLKVTFSKALFYFMIKK